MLVTPCLSSRSFSFTAVRSARCRARADMKRVRCPLATRARVRPGRIADRLPALTDGVTGAVEGCGSDGTRDALPTPEGSLIEPLSPFTLPGPGGMPLTPASCAKDGVASRTASATANNLAVVPHGMLLCALPSARAIGVRSILCILLMV
jgi:hypothetical protein